MLANILAFLGPSSCALPPVKVERGARWEKSKKDELAILFIGNSYSFGLPTAFKKLARAHGKKVKVGHSTFGGWSLTQHSEYPPTLKKLREGNWDIVVLQDHSLNPGQKESKRRRVMDPGVQLLANEARAVGSVPMLYQTWGRRDGDTSIAGDDFFKMNARVRQGYQSASSNAGGIDIVPVGDAWEREYRAGRGRELYVEDGSHPSAIGDQVTAQVFYEAIFKQH